MFSLQKKRVNRYQCLINIVTIYVTNERDLKGVSIIYTFLYHFSFMSNFHI